MSGSTPADTRELLLAYGLPLVDERLASGPDEAVAAAEALGYPVVVKTAPPGAHKTELGGIALDLVGRRRRASRGRADRRAGDRAADDPEAAPSSWPASSRIPSSGRWSPSAPAASSPS